MAVGTEFIINQLKYIVLTESGTTGTVSVGAKDTDITGDIVIPETVSNGGITYTVNTIRSDYQGSNIGFYNCNQITSIYFPKTISSNFVWSTISQTPKLRSYNVDPDSEYYSSLDGVLFNKDKTKLIKYPEGKLEKSYIIPNNVIAINEYSFYKSHLEYIYGKLNYNLNGASVWAYPKLIKLSSFYINNYNNHFAHSNTLKYINIPGYKLTSNSFRDITSLREVTIGSEVTTGSFDVFSGSINIQTVNVDSQYVVDHFKDFFPQITSSTSPLKYVNIGDSVTSMAANAFLSGSSLREVNLGNNIILSNDYAFAECTNLRYIKKNNNESISGSLQSLRHTSVYNLSILDLNLSGVYPNILNIYFKNRTNISLLYLNTCRKINLYNTENLYTSSITYSTTIKSVTLPNSIKHATYGLNSFNLISLVFEGNAPITSSNYTGLNSNCKVYYYQDTIGWESNFAGIPTQKVFRGEVTVGNFTYKFVDGINGTPNVSVRVANNVKLTAGNVTGTNIPSNTVTIDGVTYTVRYIADNGFENQYNLESYDFNNQYLEIGKNAFKGCRNLKTATNTNGITDIYESAFEGCSNLQSFVIQTISNVYHPIYKNTFKDCKKLQSITLSSYCYDIEESAFENCTSLTSINIPDECNHIYKNAFKNCKSLQTVTYGTNLYIIHDDVFLNCYKLQTFTAASGSTNNLETLKDNVFMNCYKLQEAPMGAIRDIGKRCFYNNLSLTSLTLPATTDYVDDEAFGYCKNLTTLTNNSPANAEFGNDVFVGTDVSL